MGTHLPIHGPLTIIMEECWGLLSGSFVRLLHVYILVILFIHWLQDTNLRRYKKLDYFKINLLSSLIHQCKLQITPRMFGVKPFPIQTYTLQPLALISNAIPCLFRLCYLFTLFTVINCAICLLRLLSCTMLYLCTLLSHTIVYNVILCCTVLYSPYYFILKHVTLHATCHIILLLLIITSHLLLCL